MTTRRQRRSRGKRARRREFGRVAKEAFAAHEQGHRPATLAAQAGISLGLARELLAVAGEIREEPQGGGNDADVRRGVEAPEEAGVGG